MLHNSVTHHFTLHLARGRCSGISPIAGGLELQLASPQSVRSSDVTVSVTSYELLTPGKVLADNQQLLHAYARNYTWRMKEKMSD